MSEDKLRELEDQHIRARGELALREARIEDLELKLESQLERRDKYIKHLENTVQECQNHIRVLENEIVMLKTLLQRYRTLADKWFPFGTKRRSAVEKLVVWLVRAEMKAMNR